MTVAVDKLDFKWDPDAGKSNSHTREMEARRNKVSDFEAYFEFLEQFDLSRADMTNDEYVDKKFTL